MTKPRDWSSEEINFVAQNRGKLTYEEMARVLGRTKWSIKGKISHLARASGAAQECITSMCWSCKNAYAQKCAWVSDLKRCWNKSVTRTDNEYAFDVVTDCDYYEKEA